MINTIDSLYKEISDNLKPNTKRPSLGEFMTLKKSGKTNKIEFTRGWDDSFTITFNPKTVGVKIYAIDKKSEKSKSVSKQYPLNQENLLDIILDLYENLLK